MYSSQSNCYNLHKEGKKAREKYPFLNIIHKGLAVSAHIKHNKVSSGGN